MNLHRLNQLYRLQVLPDSSDLASLRQLISDYPGFSKPYVILARHYHDTGHYKFEDMLKQAAMRVADRRWLYDYIQGQTIEKQGEQLQALQTESVISPALEPAAQTEETADLKPGIDEFLSPPSWEENIAEPLADALAPEMLIAEIPEHPATGGDEISLIEESTEEKEEPTDAFTDMLTRFGDAESMVTESEKPLEFEFEGHFKEHEVVLAPEEHDIIGEEIATEFSFSKTFTPAAETISEALDQEVISPETAAQQAEEKQEPAPDEKSGFSPDLNTEAEPETAEEETEFLSDGNADVTLLKPDPNLRKYPVYSVEHMLGEQQNAEAGREENEDPAMDFFAWLSKPGRRIETAPDTAEPLATAETEPDNSVQNRSLDLIERFIAVNPQISRPRKEFFNPENMAKRSEILDPEFVSETLANIYFEQGNYDMAQTAYEKLSLQNPSKRAYFADLIEKIKKERK